MEATIGIFPNFNPQLLSQQLWHVIHIYRSIFQEEFNKIIFVGVRASTHAQRMKICMHSTLKSAPNFSNYTVQQIWYYIHVYQSILQRELIATIFMGVCA